jgi:glycosyltransferase involved in cell wall biosynthesis
VRVLIVSQYFWPENFRINDVSETLVEKGIEVEVLTGKPNYPAGQFYAGYGAAGCQKETYRGVNIERIPLLARGRGSFKLALNYVSFVFSGLLLAPWVLRKKKFDVIFVYAPSPILQAIPALLIGFLKGCPVVLWVQDLWPESLSATGYIKNHIIIALVRHVVRFIYRSTDLILVQSRAFKEKICNLAPAADIIYYPNSVDDSFTVPVGEEPPMLDGLCNGFSILFAGNIGAAQGVSVIVEAASLLKDHTDIHFIVLGDGSSREWMLNEVRLRGLSRLHLPGRFPVEKMPAFMQNASALLVTLSDQPIFSLTVPNKVQAYMAAGRPIIACINGEGARLVLEAKAGLASPAGDARALADTVLKLYSLAPEKREQMGFNGRAYYKEHFNHDQLVDQLIGLLQAVSLGRKELN